MASNTYRKVMGLQTGHGELRKMREAAAEHARQCNQCDDRASVPVWAGGPYGSGPNGAAFVSHHDLCPAYSAELLATARANGLPRTYGRTAA